MLRRIRGKRNARLRVLPFLLEPPTPSDQEDLVWDEYALRGEDPVRGEKEVGTAATRERQAGRARPTNRMETKGDQARSEDEDPVEGSMSGAEAGDMTG
jgi:hypothetical protein